MPLRPILRKYAARHSKNFDDLLRKTVGHRALIRIIDRNPRVSIPAQDPRFADRTSGPFPNLLLVGEFFDSLSEDQVRVNEAERVKPKIVWDHPPQAVLFDFKPNADGLRDLSGGTYRLRLISVWDGEYGKAMVDLEEAELEVFRRVALRAWGNIGGSGDVVPPHFQNRRLEIDGSDFLIRFKGVGHNPYVFLKDDREFDNILSQSQSNYAFLVFDVDKEYFFVKPKSPWEKARSFNPLTTSFGWKVPEIWTLFWKLVMVDSAERLGAPLPGNTEPDELPFLTERGFPYLTREMKDRLLVGDDSVELSELLLS